METKKNEKKQTTDQQIEKKGYTKGEIPFADGKDTKLDKATDNTSPTNDKK